MIFSRPHIVTRMYCIVEYAENGFGSVRVGFPTFVLICYRYVAVGMLLGNDSETVGALYIPRT